MSTYSTRNEIERTTWPNKLEYHLSLFSYVLGLVSFWRFPYLAYENGGAPFVYVFLLLYILIGIPLIFLEMAWGQYGNLAPLQVFKTVPAMQGIGVCMVFLSCSVLLYCGVASYYFLIYLVSSFSYSQPWSTCSHEWNTQKCQTTLSADCVASGTTGLVYRQGDGHGIQDGDNFTKKMLCNYTSDGTQTTPAVEYWANNLVYNGSVCSSYADMSEVLIGFDASNMFVTPVVILACFAGVRIIVAMIAMANNVRLTGKIGYFLSAISFSVIAMLLVRCVTLAGSVTGLEYLFVPTNTASFMSPKIWKDACGQVFLTIMASWGGLITWSSYNRFYNKYHIDATLLVLIVPMLSLLCAVAMFGVVGYLATGSNVPPELALRGARGPFVALVAYSEALSQMWGNTLPWSIVVFASLFLSSTSAMFPCLECVLSCLSDAFPIFRRLLLRNIALLTLLLLSIGTCFVVPCFVEGTGLQIIQFFDAFSLPLCFMIVALAEVIMLSYAFGFKLIYTNTKAMTGNSCLKSHFWSVMWGGVTPLVLLACVVYTLIGVVRDGVASMSPYIPPGVSSTWGSIAGGVLVAFIFLVLVLVALIKVVQSSGSCVARLRSAFTPHLSGISGNGAGNISHTNGELFMSDYSSHRERGIEILIDEDIVTTV